MNPDRYTVISADGHAGASVPTYREYLASRWHDEFDAWAQTFQNPFADLAGSNAYRNWDSRRSGSPRLEADGIVAEVLFPNTIPPFFPSGALVTPAPNRGRVRAPLGRTAGAQPLARRLLRGRARPAGRRRPDPAERPRRRARRGASSPTSTDLFGGVLLPGVPPNHEIAPLWSDVYEPLWALCEELDVVVNHHSGGGLPDVRPHRSGGARGDARRDPDLRAPRAVGT